MAEVAGTPGPKSQRGRGDARARHWNCPSGTGNIWSWTWGNASFFWGTSRRQKWDDPYTLCILIHKHLYVFSLAGVSFYFLGLPLFLPVHGMGSL